MDTRRSETRAIIMALSFKSFFKKRKNINKTLTFICYNKKVKCKNAVSRLENSLIIYATAPAAERRITCSRSWL